MNQLRHVTLNKLVSTCMLLSMVLAPLVLAPLGPAGAGVEAAPPDAPPPARLEREPIAAAPAAPAADVNPGLSKSWNGGSPIVGTDISYEIYFYGDAMTVTHGVIITDALPPNTSLVSWVGTFYNPDDTMSGNATVIGDQVVWDLGDLAVGRSGYIYPTLHISDTAVGGDRMTNTVQLSTSDSDLDLSDNQAEHGTQLITPTRDLQLTKSFYDGNPLPGNAVVHRLECYNSGNMAARDVVLTDTLPAGLEYESYSGDDWSMTQNGSTLVFSRPELGAYSSDSVYVTVRIANTAAPGDILTNTAVVTTSDPDIDPSDQTAVLGMTVETPLRDVQVEKGLQSGAPAPGNDVVYWLRARNNSSIANATARDISLTDILPAQLSYVSHEAEGWTFGQIGSTLIFTRAELEPSSNWSYLYVTAHVADSATPGDTLTNSVSISTSDDDANPANNSATDTRPVVVPTWDVSVGKSLYSGNPTPGNHMTYRITYQNSGNRPAENVVVADTFPEHTTFVTFTQNALYTPTWDSGHITWTMGTLPPNTNGYLYVTVRLSELVAVDTLITNTAAISTSSAETGVSPNSAQVVHTVRQGMPDVYVNKSFLDSSAAPGSEVHYRISYGNQDSDAALNVVLTDTLPPGVSYVSSNGPLEPTQVGDALVWELGTMPGNTDASFDLTVYIAGSVPVDSVLTNQVVISTPNDTNSANNSDDDGGQTVVAATRDLSVSKTLSGGYLVPGAVVTYQVYYSNDGTASARGVVLTDTLPEGASFVSSDPLAPTQVGKLLVWELGTLPANGNGSLYVAIRLSDELKPGNAFCNRVDVTTTDAETGSNSNTGTSCETIQPPSRDVYVSKSLQSGVPAAGNTVTYRIDYGNSGNSPAADVVVTDTLPAGLTYDPTSSSSDSPGWSRQVSGNQVIWTRPALNASQYGALYVSALIPAGVPPKTVLTNTAQIATSNVETDYADNLSTVAHRVLAPGRDLVVSKSWTDGQSAGGHQLTYRIDYRNDGLDAASDVVITDTLPVEMSYSSASSSGWSVTHSAHVITWTRSSLAGGGSGSINLTITITDPIPSARVLTNRVGIAGSQSDNDPSDNTASLPLTIYPATRDLYLSKSLDSVALVPGRDATYSLYYRNYGSAPAAGVLVADTLPAGVSFVSASGGINWTLSGNQVVWQLGTVAGQYNSGYSGNLYLTVHVPDTAAVGGRVCNQAAISTGDSETGLRSNAAETCELIQSPRNDVRVTKSGSPVPPGENLRYTISVYNDGNVAAHDIVVTDTLPAGTSYVSDDNTAGFTRVTQAGDTVVWTRPQVDAGDVATLNLTARVADAATAGQVLANTVRVSASDADEFPADNSYVLSLAVVEPVRDMHVEKSLSGQAVPPGGTMVYRLRVTNEGNVTARDIVVTDMLPAGVSYVSDSNAAGFTRAMQSGDTVVWTRPQMDTTADPADLYLTVRVTDTAAVGQVLTNTVQVSAIGGDNDPGDDLAELGVAVPVPTRDVYVIKSMSTPAAPGGSMTYNIYFGNWGNSTARDVIFTDTLPAGVSLVSWSGYLNDSYYTALEDMVSLEQSGRQLVWRIGELSPGQYGYLYPKVRVAETLAVGQVLTNVVRASTGDVDIQLSNNVATNTVSVAAPTRDMRVDKWLHGGAPVAGQPVRYTISFENEGNSTAHGVVVTDRLPAGTSYVSWYGSFYNPRHNDLDEMITPTVSGDQVIWHINPLIAGGYGYIYPTFHLTGTASPGQVLTNVVHASTSDVDVNAGNNVEIHTTTVITPGPDMSVHKSLAGSDASPGSEIRYEIDFSNAGQVAVSDVILTDTLPAGTTFVSWSGYAYTPGYVNLNGIVTPTVSGRQVVWHLGQVPAGQYGTIYPTLRVSDALQIGTVLTNVAHLSISPGETNVTDNVFTYTSSVISPTYSWDVYVDKTQASGYKSPSPGGETRYRLNFSNLGNQPAADVVITDTLPPGAVLVSWYSNMSQVVTPTQVGSHVVWHIGTLEAGAYGSIYPTVRIDAAAKVRDLLVNVARISTSDSDDNPSNDVYTYTTRVVQPRADVSVDKYLYSLAGVPGGEMTYELYFSNHNSNWPASGLVITDSLPPEVSLVSWSGYMYSPDHVNLAGIVTPTVSGRQVVWRLPTPLVVGGYGYIRLVVHVSSASQVGDQLTNVVTATSSVIDPDPSGNADVYIGRLLPAVLNLQVWKGVVGLSARSLVEAAASGAIEREPQADSRRPAEEDQEQVYSSAALIGGGYPPTGTVAAGRCFGYELAFNSASNINAANVVITDDLPAGVNYRDWHGYAYNPNNVDLRQAVTPTVSGNRLVWNLGQIAAGGYGFIYLDVCAASTLQVGESLVNRVDISTGGQEETLIDNSATATVTVSAFVLLADVGILGPTTGTVGVDNAFTAVVTPSTASRPITYTWSSDGLISGQGTASAVYRWSTMGVRTISLVATNDGAPVTATHTITIGQAAAIGVTNVHISGLEETGQVGVNYTFTATAAPPNATPPINYTWSSADLVSGQGSPVATYRWTTEGVKTISVTASNAGGSATASHNITLQGLQPVTDTVGPAGGTFVYTNTGGVTTTFEVPPGAIGEQLELRYTPTYSVPANGDLLLVGPGFELDLYRDGQRVADYTFTGTVTLTIRYADADVLGPPSVVEDTIKLYRRVTSAWEEVGTRPGEGQSLDTGRNVLTAWLRGLSLFGKFGEGVAYDVYLPLVIKNG